MPVYDDLFIRLDASYLSYTFNSIKFLPDSFGLNDSDVREKTTGKLNVPESDNSIAKATLKAQLLFVPLYIDYHPFSNGLKLSLGTAYSDIHFKADFTPTKNIKVSDKTFTPEEIGSFNMQYDLGNKIVPILSVGYDSSFVTDSTVNFTCDVGIAYIGKSKVKLGSSGKIKETADSNNAITELEQKLQEESDKHMPQFSPVINLGVRFNL